MHQIWTAPPCTKYGLFLHAPNMDCSSMHQIWTVPPTSNVDCSSMHHLWTCHLCTNMDLALHAPNMDCPSTSNMDWPSMRQVWTCPPCINHGLALRHAGPHHLGADHARRGNLQWVEALLASGKADPVRPSPSCASSHPFSSHASSSCVCYCCSSSSAQLTFLVFGYFIIIIFSSVRLRF